MNMAKIVIHFHKASQDAGYKSLSELKSDQSEDRARIREAVQTLNDKIVAYNARTKKRIEAAMALGSDADSGSYIYGTRVKVNEVI